MNGDRLTTHFGNLVYNGIGIPIAAGALYPALGLTLSPMIAAAAMALSSLSVVANANRLKTFRPKPINEQVQVIATEPVRAFGAFKRADALSSGRVMQGIEGLVKVRLTVLVTVIGGVLLIVSIVASLPTLIAGAASGASFEPGHTLTDVLPLAILVPLQLVQTVLGALVAPLYVVFQTFFYVDMRVRREALDLELALTA